MNAKPLLALTLVAGSVLHADDAFLERIRQRQLQIESEVKDVTYTARGTGRELDEQGQVKRETVTVRKVYIKTPDRQASEILSIQVNGRELEGKEREREIERTRGRQGGRRADMPFVPGSWTNYLYTVEGRATFEGQPVRLVSFRPRRPRIGTIAGTAWVLENSGDIVRMDFRPGRSPFVLKKADFRLDYGRIPQGYWFPYSFTMELVVELKAAGLDLTHTHVQVRETYSDYRINTGLPDSLFRRP